MREKGREEENAVSEGDRGRMQCWWKKVDEEQENVERVRE